MITCDSSAYLVSDLLPATGPRHPGIECRTPHHLGNGNRLAAGPVAPDFTAQKNQAAQYKKFASLQMNVITVPESSKIAGLGKTGSLSCIPSSIPERASAQDI